MKKICLWCLVVVFMLSLTACGNDTVTLHCDGENCSNTVEVEVTKDETPNEDWVVFCRDCTNNSLAD